MQTLMFFNKWVHLFSICGVVGGIFFAAIVLAPGIGAAEGEDPAARRRVWRRFGITLGILWVLVLATGGINYYLLMAKVNAGYHMLVGVKIVLVLLMVVISGFAGHPGRQGSRPGRGPLPWLAVLVVLAIAVLGISTQLNLSRLSGAGLKPAAAQVARRD
ncbi:MAG: hypothetical protein IT208_17945 [Chthonomonadales bacterium]|nr:hypothetical protein [Chthonomonadales bacterium]